MSPSFSEPAVKADIERLEEKIDKLNETIQTLALVQKEQATNYSFIADMAKTHAKALYGNNGYVGLVPTVTELSKKVDNHEIQINGKPDDDENSLTYIVHTLKEKFDTVSKIVWIAAGAAVTSGVVSLIEALKGR